MSNKRYFLIVVLIAIGTLISFYSGFFTKDLLKKTTIITTTGQEVFKPIFIDEFFLVSKEKPHHSIRLSAFRQFKENETYTYIIKAFYYDGQKWSKEVSKGEYSNIYLIPNTKIIPQWNVEYDPSYMLRQSAKGQVVIENNKIGFNIPDLYNEMNVRSSPKYTKFMSEADAVMTINNKEYPSYVLYSRVYSFDAPESLIFTDDPAGIETEWLAFWDMQGNFYSIDETIVDNKITSDTYKAHSMAVEKDIDGKVLNSFDLNIKEKVDKNKGYTVNILGGINKTISVNKINSINNGLDQGEKWFIGQVEGTINNNGKILNGYGFFEQVSQ